MDLFRSPQFATHVEKLMQENHVPGLAVALVHNNDIASQGFGYTSLEKSKPCTPDTLFDIASASKSLTAASVALLVDDEENHPDLDWESPMSTLLPEDFVMSEQSYTDQITVEDVLSHRTGLPSHDSSYLGINATHPDNARSVTRNLRNLAVVAPIRTEHIYCNLMFTVATHLVEVKSGLPFPKYLRKHFFEPLGMASTSLQPDEARSLGLGDRITDGHWWDEKMKKLHKVIIEQSPEDQGSGSIITSVNDYIKYVKAIMNQETPFTEDVYQDLIRIRSMQKPDPEDTLPFYSPAMYALGWEVTWYRGHLIVQHDGNISGFTSAHFFLPKFKFGGVLLANADGGSKVISVLVNHLIDELIRVPQTERLDWDAVLDGETDEGGDDEDDSDDSDDDDDSLWQTFSPRPQKREEQTIPLSAYTGVYFNKGYHHVTVQVKDDKLFIDASDRSGGFTMTLEHVCDQTKYVVHLSDLQGEGGGPSFKGEFKLKDGKAEKLGLHMESDLKDYIWFDRTA